MRNVVVRVLAPKENLIVQVSPPMKPTERPIILTASKMGMVIQQLANDAVRIENPTSFVAPIIFFVTNGNAFELLGTVKNLLGGAT